MIQVVVGIGTLAHMGGAERQAVYLAEHLQSIQRCRVSVVTFTDGPVVRAPLDKLQIPIVEVPYYEKWPLHRRLRSLFRLAVCFRRIHADVLLPFGTPTSKAFGIARRFSKARYCWWNQQDEGRGLYCTTQERRVLSAASCINSNSEAGRDFLCEKFHLPREQVFVYNNGTPIPESIPDRSLSRAGFDFGDRPVVTMVANLSPFKDHETLIDCWPLVKDRIEGPERPLLALAGKEHEAGRMDALKRRAFDLGLSVEDIRFLGPVSDVPSLIAASDVFVHSSITEGCPNAVCEAMALARPVVATDIPGCRQALGSINEHWLVPEKDPRTLASRILELLDSPDLRTSIGSVNRRRIVSDFSIQGMNRFFTSLIPQLSE